MNSFIHQGHIQLIKCVSRGNYNVTKDYSSNKCCSFELAVYQKILKN